jgi:hypothetical protein
VSLKPEGTQGPLLFRRLPPSDQVLPEPPCTIPTSAAIGRASSHSIKSEKGSDSAVASLYEMDPHFEPPTAAKNTLTLEQEVQQQPAARHSKLEEKSNTFAAYRRHYARYQSWWDQDQARRFSEAESANVAYERVEALPITMVKVALFLEHERKRNRVCESLIWTLILSHSV